MSEIREALDVEVDRSIGIVSCATGMYLTGSKKRTANYLGFATASEDNENGAKFLEFRFRPVGRGMSNWYVIESSSSDDKLYALSPTDVSMYQPSGISLDKNYYWVIEQVRDGEGLFSFESVEFGSYLSINCELDELGPGLEKGDRSTNDNLLWKLNVFTSEDKSEENLSSSANED